MLKIYYIFKTLLKYFHITFSLKDIFDNFRIILKIQTILQKIMQTTNVVSDYW